MHPGYIIIICHIHKALVDLNDNFKTNLEWNDIQIFFNRLFCCVLCNSCQFVIFIVFLTYLHYLQWAYELICMVYGQYKFYIYHLLTNNLYYYTLHALSVFSLTKKLQLILEVGGFWLICTLCAQCMISKSNVKLC